MKRANADGATAEAGIADDAFLDGDDDAATQLETPSKTRRHLIAMRSRYPRLQAGNEDGDYRETVFEEIWKDRIRFQETFKPSCFFPVSADEREGNYNDSNSSE